MFWVLWIVSLFIGAFGYEMVPAQFQYIEAFAAGTVSFMFLQLARDKDV